MLGPKGFRHAFTFPRTLTDYSSDDLVVFSMLMAVAWYKLPGVPSGLSFNNETFFLVILPFIIFESGFSAHRQSFFRNMGSILMYAIIGTFVASFGIGGFLYATVRARGAAYNFSFLDCMIVGAVMSSTDPVATLSIVRTRNNNDSKMLSFCAFRFFCFCFSACIFRWN